MREERNLPLHPFLFSPGWKEEEETAHGTPETASTEAGFDYGGSWHDDRSTALIDWIAEYEYNDTVTPKLTWNYQLNGIYQNYFSNTTGVSNNPIGDGDYIEFYYGPDQQTTDNAVAFVRITVEVAEGLCGDVNNDGRVTMGDAG